MLKYEVIDSLRDSWHNESHSAFVNGASDEVLQQVKLSAVMQKVMTVGMGHTYFTRVIKCFSPSLMTYCQVCTH